MFGSFYQILVCLSYTLIRYGKYVTSLLQKYCLECTNYSLDDLGVLEEADILRDAIYDKADLVATASLALILF